MINFFEMFSIQASVQVYVARTCAASLLRQYLYAYTMPASTTPWAVSRRNSLSPKLKPQLRHLRLG